MFGASCPPGFDKPQFCANQVESQAAFIATSMKWKAPAFEYASLLNLTRL